MAPRKKAEETKTKPSTTPATRRSARMTRSAAKRLNARLTELPTDAGKKRKQGKAEESKKKSVLPYVGEKADSWLVGVASFIKGFYLLHDPRRGCFEIREEGGETFTSLLNMKRPFPPLKGLDMDEVTSIISTGSKAQPMHLIEFGWSLKSVLEPYSHFGLLLTSSYDEPTWKSESMLLLFFHVLTQPMN
ncbi:SELENOPROTEIN H [Salix koriyanagi]|uniref:SELENOPROTEIN H n=1 Tax=Salix koriyanagi TaxID=2511006 RepID=A0A9Q0VAK3_9ROSI|nr:SELENOPROTEIN H [Salix koriyanagi]